MSNSIIYQIFLQKYNEIREDIRTRKTFTMLSNMKSLKIRTDKIEIIDINSITLEHFKPQDKKLLIDLFCNDELVQQITNDVLAQNRIQNNDLTTLDMLAQIQKDPNALPQSIDQNGNVIRAKSSQQPRTNSWQVNPANYIIVPTQEEK